jgi:hypothetical protein
MTLIDLQNLIIDRIPSDEGSDIMWWMMFHFRDGAILPFMAGLLERLVLGDYASTGYAERAIDRIAEIPRITDAAREALYQIVGEVYCAAGAVEIADQHGGVPVFVNEPYAASGLKNPEFEFQYQGTRYAVEVKTPGWIRHRRQRSTNPIQINTRLPGQVFSEEPRTLPRDNPVKDFLISADRKFAAYRERRPEPFRILSIVWDEFVNEPIAALTSPVCGLSQNAAFIWIPSANAKIPPHRRARDHPVPEANPEYICKQ